MSLLKYIILSNYFSTKSEFITAKYKIYIQLHN